MTSNVTSRATARKALAALLSSALGSAVDVVHDHTVSDLGMKVDHTMVQKAVVVTSVDAPGGTPGGVRRMRDTNDMRSESEIYFNVFAFVLSTIDTEATAEDDLDGIEKKISDTIIENSCVPGSWAALDFADRTMVKTIPLVSAEYKRETIPVVMTIYDD